MAIKWPEVKNHTILSALTNLLQDDYKFRTRHYGGLLQGGLRASYTEVPILPFAEIGTYDSESQGVDLAVAIVKYLFSLCRQWTFLI